MTSRVVGPNLTSLFYTKYDNMQTYVMMVKINVVGYVKVLSVYKMHRVIMIYAQIKCRREEDFRDNLHKLIAAKFTCLLTILNYLSACSKLKLEKINTQKNSD